MYLARQFAAAAVTALLLIAGACFVFVSSAADAQAEGLSGTCEDAADLAVLSSPIAPWKGAPLRVIFTAEKPLEGELSLIAPDGSVAAKSRERHGGPPYFWFAEVPSPAAGTWQVTLGRDHAPAGCSAITREIAVRDAAAPPPSATPDSVWPVRNTWNRATENLYSAWIAKLFDAFETIAGMPGIGHSRTDLTAFPVLFWAVGAYLIVYRSDHERIEIVGVTQGSRDIPLTSEAQAGLRNAAYVR